MSVIGTLELTYSVDCKACGATCSGSGQKTMYFAFLMHLRRCKKRVGPKPPLFRTLWQLWRWKP